MTTYATRRTQDQWKGTDYNDPLNEILLPAYGNAMKIKHGELKSARRRETTLAAGFLVLMAERESMRMLYRDAVSELDRVSEELEEFYKQAPAATTEAIKGYLRLKYQIGVPTDAHV